MKIEIEQVTLKEFNEALTSKTIRVAYGANQALLRRCEEEPVKLTFETERKAVSKLTALYVVRRKMDAQVRLVRRGVEMFIGPGEYVRTERKERKK